MTHCRVCSVDRFLEADSGGKIQWIGLSFGCSILGYSPSPTHVENGEGVRGGPNCGRSCVSKGGDRSVCLLRSLETWLNAHGGQKFHPGYTVCFTNFSASFSRSLPPRGGKFIPQLRAEGVHAVRGPRVSHRGIHVRVLPPSALGRSGTHPSYEARLPASSDCGTLPNGWRKGNNARSPLHRHPWRWRQVFYVPRYPDDQ